MFYSMSQQTMYAQVSTHYARHACRISLTWHLFYPTLKVPRATYLFTSFNRSTPNSSTPLPPSDPTEKNLPHSSTHQKTAIHLRASWQEVGHFHMELYQIERLLRRSSLSRTCTHSPSISPFVRLHSSAWSGGESRFKSPNWIIPLSSFAIQAHTPTPPQL